MANDLQASYAGKRALVTGGMGFLGSHLVARLVELGARVSVLDRDTSEERPSYLNMVPQLRERVDLHEGRVEDESLMTELVGHGSFDQIFNLAASATVIEQAIRDPRATVRSNLLGAFTLLDAVRQNRRHRPEFVLQASTDKVYGESTTEDGYDEVRSPLNATGFYDASKAAADIIVRSFHHVFGLPTIALRMVNLFGPADFNLEHRLIPRAMQAIWGQTDPQPPTLYLNSIDHRRDYLYVDDCVTAMLLIGRRAKQPINGCVGQALNLTGCKNVATPELMSLLVNIAACEERKHGCPEVADAILANGIVIEVRPADPAIVTIQVQQTMSDKLHRETGFEASVPLQDGMERTITWYRQHFKGWAVP